MSMNFANAQAQRDYSELVPAGTLARCLLRIKPHDATNGVWETPSKSGNGAYLKCDLALIGGKHDKRHLFTNINVRNQNQTAVDIGHGQIKAILECTRGQAQPDGSVVMSEAAYSMDSYGELDGVECAIKVSLEPAKGDYPEKNDIAVFLSPLQTGKDWTRFIAGDLDPDPNAIRPKAAPAAPAGGAAAAAAPRWGAAPAQQQAMPGAAPQPAPGAPAAPAQPQAPGVQGNMQPQTPAGPAAAPGAAAPIDAPWLQQANAGNPPAGGA